MKMEKLVGERFKERPSECAIDSHAFMLRGGYIKHVTNGIYTLATPMRRITQKIERIIREEMDRIGGQEVLFPVVLPASLWEESGRFQSVGSELLRITDRNDAQLVLGMTHEEAAVHLVREYGNSYGKYPFMIYQIQTKFRDEARPRGGLIRVREFTMKDAYSFHTSQADLDRYYEICLHAYERIFARAGLPEVISVASDSGMMGGSVSHEFMLLTPVGEDTIALCEACEYRANMEAAEVILPDIDGAAQALTAVHTPGMNTIDAVCGFLNAPVEGSCKAVVYQTEATGAYVIVFLRGDLDVNETKLTNHLGEAVRPAVIEPGSGICAGFIGPVGLEGGHRVVYDRSLLSAQSLVCGANRADYHNTGLNMRRDCPEATYVDVARIRPGDVCPSCGKPSIRVSRGIEVGNIFQLGTKYTEPMGMRYQDEADALQTPIMGCYGIGVGRLAASICEARHDDYGPIWPMSVAPWQVEICCLRADQADVRAVADGLYAGLMDRGVEVLCDDRPVSAGIMFSDADLMGVPLRVIVSPRNLKDGVCEVVTRDKARNWKVAVENAAEEVAGIVRGMIAEER